MKKDILDFNYYENFIIIIIGKIDTLISILKKVFQNLIQIDDKFYQHVHSIDVIVKWLKMSIQNGLLSIIAVLASNHLYC